MEGKWIEVKRATPLDEQQAQEMMGRGVGGFAMVFSFLWISAAGPRACGSELRNLSPKQRFPVDYALVVFSLAA